MAEEATNTPDTQQQTDKSIIHVKVHAPYKIYYDGEAESISAKNDTGDFDILGKHYNFISILAPGDIVIRKPDGEKETISIQQGVMHVKENEVVVFLDV
jgi:F-type H+-transporting ATPase subunit epsilon